MYFNASRPTLEPTRSAIKLGTGECLPGSGWSIKLTDTFIYGQNQESMELQLRFFLSIHGMSVNLASVSTLT